LACNTKWLEVSITVEGEVAEAAAEVLSRYAYGGVAIEANAASLPSPGEGAASLPSPGEGAASLPSPGEGSDGWISGPVMVRAYLPADDQLRATRRRVEEALWHLSQIRPVPAPIFRAIAEEDWAEAWKEQLVVLRVGQHIVIQPSWLDHLPASEDIVIQLDPGMAFGTGLHPTTQMCLAALEELVWPGADVLDLGTGSGILAIAAAKLGARQVLAVDNDSQAVKAARNNVVTNGVREIVSVKRGSLSKVSGNYDVVAVNILAKVIVDMLQKGLATRVRPGGMLITAGIIAAQAPQVITVLEQSTLALAGRRQEGDWVSLLARRG
jgi:ribosomal protein L11 methyltransferase